MDAFRGRVYSKNTAWLNIGVRASCKQVTALYPNIKDAKLVCNA